jgi:hypothetical protein
LSRRQRRLFFVLRGTQLPALSDLAPPFPPPKGRKWGKGVIALETIS